MLRAVVSLPDNKVELTAQNMGKPNIDRIQEELPEAINEDDVRVYEVKIKRYYQAADGVMVSDAISGVDILMERSRGWPHLLTLMMQYVPLKWRTDD